ncbi:MAG: Kiwa anti-phage protein KwaB-like domain-containing protein, partial [Gelidibacter sp.]
NITIIQDLDLIANIAELTAFVDNIKYAKRVLRINANSPVLQLAKLRIIEFITNHPKLSTKIRMNVTNDRIMLDTDISKIITIGILNDDYLKSNLTDLDYESENKSEIDED